MLSFSQPFLQGWFLSPAFSWGYLPGFLIFDFQIFHWFFIFMLTLIFAFSLIFLSFSLFDLLIRFRGDWFSIFDYASSAFSPAWFRPISFHFHIFFAFAAFRCWLFYWCCKWLFFAWLIDWFLHFMLSPTFSLIDVLMIRHLDITPDYFSRR